jgi:hypothetical protein
MHTLFAMFPDIEAIIRMLPCTPFLIIILAACFAVKNVPVTFTLKILSKSATAYSKASIFCYDAGTRNKTIERRA